MSKSKPKIGLASNRNVRDIYLTKNDLKKIETKFDFVWGEFNEESSWDESPTTIENVKNNFKEFCKNLDGLIVSHGSPYVDIPIHSILWCIFERMTYA